MKSCKTIHRIYALITFCLLLVSSKASALLPFEATGNLYVSMWTADEIAVFSPDGTPLERFSATDLDGPRGLAFNPTNGEIWVTAEFSDAIFIFDHEHQLLRVFEHEDFNEPVGVTFTMTAGVDPPEQLVYVSNSNGNEIMVFNQSGILQRRFSGPNLLDPNCSAFMQDGTLLVANRLGGSNGAVGAVASFDSQDNFLFDFTTSGIASLMAVARDPNTMPGGADDTLWATSGAGDTGIYEFDQSGNLLTTLLPEDIGDGSRIVPQGIAFDSAGDFYVVSFLNEVIKFDSNGNFITRFPTGDGTSRSTAFQGCEQVVDGVCVPFGSTSVSAVSANNEGVVDTTAIGAVPETGSGGGGGSIGLYSIIFLSCIRRRLLFSNRRKYKL